MHDTTIEVTEALEVEDAAAVVTAAVVCACLHGSVGFESSSSALGSSSPSSSRPSSSLPGLELDRLAAHFFCRLLR